MLLTNKETYTLNKSLSRLICLDCLKLNSFAKNGSPQHFTFWELIIHHSSSIIHYPSQLTSSIQRPEYQIHYNICGVPKDEFLHLYSISLRSATRKRHSGFAFFQSSIKYYRIQDMYAFIHACIYLGLHTLLKHTKITIREERNFGSDLQQCYVATYI